MSLYNRLFGVNPFAPIWMTMLKLKPGNCGRFRDAYLSEKGTICVYTRNGGGNREEYQPVIDELAKHECYIRDFDDDFDCTYATIEFRVPDKFKEFADSFMKEEKLQELIKNSDPAKRWPTLIQKLHSGNKDDPDVAHAMEAGKKIFGELEKKMKEGNGGVVPV